MGTTKRWAEHGFWPTSRARPYWLAGGLAIVAGCAATPATSPNDPSPSEVHTTARQEVTVEVTRTLVGLQDIKTWEVTADAASFSADGKPLMPMDPRPGSAWPAINGLRIRYQEAANAPSIFWFERGFGLVQVQVPGWPFPTLGQIEQATGTLPSAT